MHKLGVGTTVHGQYTTIMANNVVDFEIHLLAYTTVNFVASGIHQIIDLHHISLVAVVEEMNLGSLS